MPRLLNRPVYLTPLIVISLLLLLMSLPGGQRSFWNSLLPAVSAEGTYTVNSTGDGGDSNIDGICDDGTGACTLRAAMQEGMNHSGDDTIVFAPNTVGSTITLNEALPNIGGNLDNFDLSGPGASLLTIQRNPAVGTPRFRIFTSSPGRTVNISGVTIANGHTADAVGGTDGDDGGGISNVFRGTMVLTDVVVSGNRTGNGAAGLGGHGGGIYNAGTLTLINCSISGNRTGNGPPNAGGAGGGIYNPGTLTITNSSISNNLTGVGAQGGGAGAGIYSFNTLTITGSTISGNKTGGPGPSAGGGGIWTASTLTIANSTLSGNEANNHGGGLVVHTGAAATLTNVTITNNRAGNEGGGGLHSDSNLVTLLNTVVAGNFRGSAPNTTTDDIFGMVNAGSSFSLVGTGGSGGLTNGVNSNQIGVVNHGLGPLANNGGTTLTHALLVGSPALERGNNALASEAGLTTDQRGAGFVRVRDAADADTTQTVDIGAFEADPTVEDITDKSTSSDVPLSFSFNVGDQATAFASVTATSSNTTLLPNANLNVTGSGSTRTLAITPAANKFGTTTITVTAAKTISGTPVNMSDTFVLTVKAATATVVSSSSNPVGLGQILFLTATVTSGAGIPTGTVTFKVDGAAVTPPKPLNEAGVASTNIAFLTAGTRSISADYSGDGNFALSTGALPALLLITDKIAITDVSVAEGDSGTSTATFTVTLAAESNVDVKVDFATADGSATAGSDYQSTSGTLTFSPGQRTQPVSVTINGDTSFESNETFLLNLSNPVNATITDSQGTGTISNNDPQGGTLVFNSAAYTVSEADGSVLITVNRNGDATQAVTVDYATSDPVFDADSRKDYTPASGTLRFEVGESVKSFTVLVNIDAFAESSEVVQLSLANPTNGAALGVPAIAALQINNTSWTAPPANPVDDAASFVRQHYHDFLNREPDAAGLAFWSNQITECQQPGATCNAEVRRINVSAAFFLSIEFQQTGYLVERLYKTAYGDAIGHSNIISHDLPVPVVRLNEFLPDTQQIAKGVVVGAPGWEQQLAANQVAFALSFVLRPRFVAAYPNTRTPAEFVDALFLNAGVTPSAEERASVISAFQGAATSADTTARARVLARVAENPTLAAQEKQKAFVLMQYFGYLRRNPNDPQDTDYSGYDFWMMKLDQFNGNFINAEMVKSFIVSSEYRQRFGP